MAKRRKEFFRRFLECIFHSFTFCRRAAKLHYTTFYSAFRIHYEWFILLFLFVCPFSSKRKKMNVHDGNLFPLDFLSISIASIHSTVWRLETPFRCDGYFNQSIIAHHNSSAFFFFSLFSCCCSLSFYPYAFIECLCTGAPKILHRCLKFTTAPNKSRKNPRKKWNTRKKKIQ